jgi:hypothetical protein
MAGAQNQMPRGSDRADLDSRKLIDHDLRLLHVPPQQRLCHGVHLVVVGAVGELHAFLDEVVDPGRVVGVRQIHVAGMCDFPRNSLPPITDVNFLLSRMTGNTISLRNLGDARSAIPLSLLFTPFKSPARSPIDQV